LRDRLIHSRFFDLAAPDAAGTSVISWAGGLQAVKLSGELPPGWCGNLAVALSHRKISIVRGFARRVVDHRWIAELHVLPSEPRAGLSEAEYLSLAWSPPAPEPPAEIALDSYYVDSSPESGQYLFLEVHGYDRVGFLASLLGRLAALALRPEQISLETWDGRALDAFHLKDAAGGPPKPETARALSQALDALRQDQPGRRHPAPV